MRDITMKTTNTNVKDSAMISSAEVNGQDKSHPKDVKDPNCDVNGTAESQAELPATAVKAKFGLGMLYKLTWYVLVRSILCSTVKGQFYEKILSIKVIWWYKSGLKPHFKIGPSSVKKL